MQKTTWHIGFQHFTQHIEDVDAHIFGREKQEDSCSNLKRENIEWMWAVTEVVVCILQMQMRHSGL